MKNKIVEALESVINEVVPDIYEGTGDEYIKYNIINSQGDVFADDEPTVEVTEYNVHIYSKCNPKSYVKKARKALFEAGFTYPSVIQTQYENDTGLNHVTLETSIETNTDV